MTGVWPKEAVMRAQPRRWEAGRVQKMMDRRRRRRCGEM